MSVIRNGYIEETSTVPENEKPHGNSDILGKMVSLFFLKYSGYKNSNDTFC